MIQVIELLEYLGIRYKSSGKNVSQNWVEVNCASPHCSDPSEHCGINLTTGVSHCWICGWKSGIVKFIMLNNNLNYHSAIEIVNRFSDSVISYSQQEIMPKTYPQGHNCLPKEASNILPELHQNYLLKRGFDPIQIQQDYKILACDTVGYFAYRIIIPIFLDGEVVCFTGRDVTGKQESKYKNAPNDIAIIPMKETIYNIDSVKGKIIICEGPTDVWRIGKGSVATMGVEYTTTQLALLAQKEAKEIFILYDSDAIIKAEKLAAAVSTFCPKVEIIELEEGDPGSMNQEDVIKLRKEIAI